MKTTLVLDDTVMVQLREEAALQGLTISEVVEEALSRMPASRPAAALKSVETAAVDGGA